MLTDFAAEGLIYFDAAETAQFFEFHLCVPWALSKDMPQKG